MVIGSIHKEEISKIRDYMCNSHTFISLMINMKARSSVSSKIIHTFSE